MVSLSQLITFHFLLFIPQPSAILQEASHWNMPSYVSNACPYWLQVVSHDIALMYQIPGLHHSRQKNPYGRNTPCIAQPGGLMEWPHRDTSNGGAPREVEGRGKVFFTLSFQQPSSLSSIWELSSWHMGTPHQQTRRSRMWRDTPLCAWMRTLTTHYSCSQGILDLFQHCGWHCLSPPFPPSICTCSLQHYNSSL